MKKLLIPALSGLLLLSCNKNNSSTPSSTTTTPTTTADVTPPVIALSGHTNDTVSLNTVYTDPGATAQDNVDGNISSKIVVTGSINKDLVGEYRLYYNVKDAAGNSAAQMTRYVYVANDARNLEGVYLANPNCGASPTSSGTVALQASTTLNNHISLGIPDNVSTIDPTITVSGSAISIPLQSSNGNSIVGNGTISPNKRTITLSYTATSTSFYGTWNCSTTYTR